MGDGGDMFGIVVEHIRDPLLHRQCGRAPRILNLGEAGRQVVAGGVAGGQKGLVQRPGSRMGKHGLLGVFRRRVHQAQGVIGARRPRHRVGRGRPRCAHAFPGLRA